MDSDLDIGRHCKQCNLRDFLPIACQYCQHDFCRSHILEHTCSFHSTTTTITATREQASCSLCPRPSISTCSNCAKFVCPVHRFHSGCVPTTISSTSPSITTKAGNPEARALLAKHFPVKTKPTVIAKKGSESPHIQHIKMKHNAIPLVVSDTSIPIWERIHFKVLFGSQERTFWCPKTMITGRAIDLIAKSFQITISDATPAYLTSLEGEVLSNGCGMMSQVKDGETVKFVSGNSKLLC